MELNPKWNEFDFQVWEAKDWWDFLFISNAFTPKLHAHNVDEAPIPCSFFIPSHVPLTCTLSFEDVLGCNKHRRIASTFMYKGLYELWRWSSLLIVIKLNLVEKLKSRCKTYFEMKDIDPISTSLKHNVWF